MKKFAVMTSIFPPTQAVKEFCARKDWHLIVVGDKKTPVDWSYENVTYLPADLQQEVGGSLAEALPWNHYSRKLIGYLHAMKQGAQVIADVDDDNIPFSNWGELPAENEYYVIDQPGFVNIYQFFSDTFIWPRGLPLDKVRQPMPTLGRKRKAPPVSIWQFLANGDPDVDAIHRLLFNQIINFKEHPPIVLNKGTYCPFNSQNTLFLQEAFPLLYLPATVTFRFTDILRGLVAQPVLWAHGLRLGFASATVYQERNPHNYMKDFESEVPMYLFSEKTAQLAFESVSPNNSITINLFKVYEALEKHGIVSAQELNILQAWNREVSVLSAGSGQ